jgi:hypothetical protein
VSRAIDFTSMAPVVSFRRFRATKLYILYAVSNISGQCNNYCGVQKYNFLVVFINSVSDIKQTSLSVDS